MLNKLLNKLLNKFFLFLIIMLSTISNANAYIDPGTGSFIIQTILAIGGVIAFYIGYPVRIVKMFIAKFSKKKPETEKNDKKI